MVTKVLAVIDLENRTEPFKLKTSIDIDGNVGAEIHWEPSKLYPTMRIDSTYLSKQEFYFINNKENYKETQEKELKLNLGKINNRSVGFHNLSDTLNLGILLPTPYDEELASLGIKKPLPDTKTAVNRFVFTFPLPLWLTCVILSIILAYLLWVMAAIRRNGKYYADADVAIYDSEGEKIGNTKKPRGVFHLKIGKGGSNGCSVSDAEWQFEVIRVQSNVLFPWKSPHFEWHKTIGIVHKGKSKADCSGDLDKNSNRSVKVNCLNKEGENTHSVKITMASES